MNSRGSPPPIQVFCVNESAVFPTKGHESDAGWDISIVQRDQTVRGSGGFKSTGK